MKFKVMHPVSCGEVTIKIREGQRLNYYMGRDTDEGFESMACTWFMDEGVLYRDYYRRARDCDGLYEWGGVERAVMQSGQIVTNDFGYPVWDDVEHTFRDHTAEAAGY